VKKSSIRPDSPPPRGEPHGKRVVLPRFALPGGKNGPFWSKKFFRPKNGPKGAVLGANFGYFYEHIMGPILDQKRSGEGVCRRADVGKITEIIEESAIGKKFFPSIFSSPPLKTGEE